MHRTQRQLAAMETRKKLVLAGRSIICKKGLANTSIEEITAAAGVSKGTFYTYFKRKEDIVFELSQDMFGEILESAMGSDGSFTDKLRAYMVHFSAYIESSSVKLAQEWVSHVAGPCGYAEPPFHAQMAAGTGSCSTEAPDFPDTAYDRKKLPRDVAAVSELIRYGVSEGLLKPDIPVDLLAHTCVDVLYGQMLCWAMSDGSYSLKARTCEFCDNYLERLFKEYIL